MMPKLSEKKMGIDTGYANTAQYLGYEHEPKLSRDDKAVVRQAVRTLNSDETTVIKIKGLGLSKNEYELTRTAEGHIHVKRVKYNIFLRLLRLKPSMINVGSESNSDHEVGYHFLGETSRLIYKIGNDELQKKLGSQPESHSINPTNQSIVAPALSTNVVTEDVTNEISRLSHLPSKDIASELWQNKSDQEVLEEFRLLSPRKAWDAFKCLCNKNDILLLASSKRNAEHYQVLLEKCLKGLLECHCINDLVSTTISTNSEYEKVLQSGSLWANESLHPYLTTLILKLPPEQLQRFLFKFEQSSSDDFRLLVNQLVNFTSEKQEHYSKTVKVTVPNESEASFANLAISTKKGISEDAKKAIKCIEMKCFVAYLLDTRAGENVKPVAELILQFDDNFISDFLPVFNDFRCLYLPKLVAVIAQEVSSLVEHIHSVSEPSINVNEPKLKSWFTWTKSIDSWVYWKILNDGGLEPHCKELIEATIKYSTEQLKKFESMFRSAKEEYKIIEVGTPESRTGFFTAPSTLSKSNDEEHFRRCSMTSSQHNLKHGWQSKRCLTLSLQITQNELQNRQASHIPGVKTPVTEQTDGEPSDIKTTNDSFDLSDLLPEPINSACQDALHHTSFEEFKSKLQEFESLANKEYQHIKDNPIKVQLLKLCYKNLMAKYYELHMDAQVQINLTSLSAPDVSEQELQYSCELVKLNLLRTLEQEPLKIEVKLETMQRCCLQCKKNETEEKLNQAKAGLRNAEETNKALSDALMKESNKGDAKDEGRIKSLRQDIDTTLMNKRRSELECELEALSREPTNEDCFIMHDKAIKHCESQIKSKICGIMNSKLAEEQSHATPLSFAKLKNCLTTSHLQGAGIETWLDINELNKLHIISAKWYANYNSIDHLLGQEGLVEADIKDIVKRSWQHLPIYMPKEHLDNIVKLVEDTKEQKVRFTIGALTNKNACSILLSERLFQTSFLNALASEYPETLTYILTQLPTEIMDAEDYHACFLACNTLLATHSEFLKSGCWGQLDENWQAGMMTCADDLSDQNTVFFDSIINSLSKNITGTLGLNLSHLNIKCIDSIDYSAFDIEQPYMNILSCLNFATSYLCAYLTTKLNDLSVASDDEENIIERTFERNKVITGMQRNFCDIGTEICRLFLPTWDGGYSAQPVFLYYDIESNRFAVSSDAFQPRNDFALWKKVVQSDKS